MALPLYGFMEGDTIGLLIVADEKETVRDLAAKLVEAASVRVAPKTRVRVVYHNQVIDPAATLDRAGFEPLERFDVVEEKY